jgi:hypothetical protein
VLVRGTITTTTKPEGCATRTISGFDGRAAQRVGVIVCDALEAGAVHMEYVSRGDGEMDEDIKECKPAWSINTSINRTPKEI